MNILVLNPGSSSLKYALFESQGTTPKLLASGKKEDLEEMDPENAIASATEEIVREVLSGKIADTRTIGAICCRVVHGGSVFVEPTVVTAELLAEIRSLTALAPLHNPLAVAAIGTCKRILPGVPITAFFDTAFHSTIPGTASTYALPKEITQKYGFRRYGFHGIAHRHVAETVRNLMPDTNPHRLITCHLGSGASICAVKDGKSIDTSMGYTPLEGLIMGTRSGDLDPGIVLQLLQNHGVAADKITSMLNHASGLLGISGVSGDLRVIEQAANKGSPDAELALACYAYRAAKYFGAYIAALGGVDAIAFSGGVGEHSPTMRARICAHLTCFGIELDTSANFGTDKTFGQRISLKENRIAVWVIHADEELQMAKEFITGMPIKSSTITGIKGAR